MLRLDEATQHLDRKLPVALRKRLEKSVPVWEIQAQAFEKKEVGADAKEKNKDPAESSPKK